MKIDKNTPGWMPADRPTATIAELSNPPARPTVHTNERVWRKRMGMNPAFQTTETPSLHPPLHVGR